MHVLTIPIGIE